MLLNMLLECQSFNINSQPEGGFYLEVCRVPELPVAVGASEPGLVGVSHQVVVKTVLPGEGGPA